MKMKYNEYVKALFKKWGITNTPVDLGKIVEILQIKILEQDLDDSVSAALVLKENKAYIVVNENHSPVRMRFSIAHEIAHYLLHKNSAKIFIENKSIIFRDEKSSKGVDRKEIEANKLAAEILMPQDAILKAVEYYMVDMNDDEKISALSKKFEVSEQAMTIRLLKLNLLHNLI